MKNIDTVAKQLFDTGALRLAPEGAPFWYTSGKIGPYFINTHFLYGGEQEAGDLLQYIDKNADDPAALVEGVFERVEKFYNTNSLYKLIADSIYDQVKDIPQVVEADYISGGARRDWFFSVILARLLHKPHLFIFKNLSVYCLNCDFPDLENKKIVHIADLITEASSYLRAWIPAIKERKGTFDYTISVVDRGQGGTEILQQQGIDVFACVTISGPFLQKIKEDGIITDTQLELIEAFSRDPDAYGRDFLTANPQFLQASLNSQDAGIQSKARRCVEENPYALDFKKLGII